MAVYGPVCRQILCFEIVKHLRQKKQILSTEKNKKKKKKKKRKLKNERNKEKQT